MELSPDQFFYCIDGSVLKSIEEFANSLKNMDDAAFRHHVSPMRNDFAIWIRHVFHENDLAEALEKSKDKEEMLDVLDEYLHAPAIKEEVRRELTIQEQLKTRLVELRKRISEKRKQGGYTKISELKLMNIPSKIKMLEIEPNNKDIDKIKATFDEVEEDLKVEYP